MALKLKKSALERETKRSPEESRHKVLVVDDEPENQRAISSALENDYDVLTADDGAEALKLIKNHNTPKDIHLIISDQRMPNMTGVEFLEKTISILPRSIRIILTGFTDVDAIIDSINKGQVYKFMTKPIDPKDLQVTVKRALERFELEQSVLSMEQKLLRCPLTQLYNESYFGEYLSEEVKNGLEYHLEGALLLIELDHISDITLNYGLNVLDDTIRGIAYVLEQHREQNHFLFRLKGPSFAAYLPFTDTKEATATAERFRSAIEKSDTFVKKITVCIGIVGFEEFFDKESVLDPNSEILNLVQARLKIAKKNRNQVCYESPVPKASTGKILIIDEDEFGAGVLKKRLEMDHFEVLTAADGAEGLNLIETEVPDVIIAEVMTPKVDGFLVREKIMGSSELKSKVFILLSHLKDENTIQRAISLKIEHYFQKPYFPSEIVGLIKNKLEVKK